MKYSLRSLMIVVTLACVACYLIPQSHLSPWGTRWYSWNREQGTVVFIVGAVIAFAGMIALARSSSYEKP